MPESTLDKLAGLKSKAPEQPKEEEVTQIPAAPGKHRAQSLLPANPSNLAPYTAPVQREVDAKVAVFYSAWELYLRLRPTTKLQELPAPPNASSPAETRTKYAEQLQANMRVAMQYSSTEAKALWKALFNKDI